MIQQCFDLALGRAFTPDSLDCMVPLAARFARRPLIAVTIYKDGIEAMAVTFAGVEVQLSPAEFCPGGAEDADAAFLRGFAERYKAKDCIINLAIGYTAVLSSRTRRADTDEEALLLMRDNPERLLGEPPAMGCRHSVAYHPTHSFAVVFAHKEADINAALSLAARANLGLARLQCGMTSLLVTILGRYWNDIGAEAELLFVERGSLFYLPAAEGGFGRPLFDVGLKEAALKQAISERVGKLKPGGRVLLVDTSGLDVAAMIAERSDITVVTPLAKESNPAVRACCSDQPRLGYDLYPTERQVRPFAPQRMRVVPFIFWTAVAATVVVVGLNTFRETHANTLSNGYQSQVKSLGDGKHHTEGVIKDIQAREKTAAAMYDWLRISPPAQALLIQITEEIKGATEQSSKENKSLAQVDSLSLTLQEGQPQMRLVVVLKGDAASANRVFQRISALFSRLDYSTVDLKQTLVPQGVRYEHLLNMPKTAGL
jgi:hypothetical protein